MSLRRSLILMIALSLPSFAQESQSKHLDINTNSGSLHVGSDADARKVGLPLYPGARPDKDGDSSQANFSLLTETLGVKLVVAKYESDDAPTKVVDFYRDKLRKYGKVLECHASKHGVDVNDDKDSDDDKHSSKSKELKCDENSGPVTELKVGTEDNQRVVTVEPKEKSGGSAFALVYLLKQGDL